MTAIGALIGLLLAIVLVVCKNNPTYCLILGALVGGLCGGLSLLETVDAMQAGVKDITPAIIRILTAGVLTGVLIKTGAATSIAYNIISAFGSKRALFAVTLSTMILSSVGVFIDVAVITVAPVALAVARRLDVPKMTVLLAMIGGGKCGNIISPNPNTIIAAENFQANLFSVMGFNLLPAVVGLLFVILVVRLVPKSGERVTGEAVSVEENENLPSFLTSIIAPVVAMVLLALRPLFGIKIDPLVALPIGGVVGVICMGRAKLFKESISFGLEKMSVVAILLVGTGTIAGVIKSSTLSAEILNLLVRMNLNELLIAPISGALMSAATASTTAGATVASASFAQAILAAGVSGVMGAAMINAGATVFDHLPHGSFFHATGGAATVNLRERLTLIPYESAIGFVLAFCCTLLAYFSSGMF